MAPARSAGRSQDGQLLFENSIVLDGPVPRSKERGPIEAIIFSILL